MMSICFFALDYHDDDSNMRLEEDIRRIADSKDKDAVTHLYEQTKTSVYGYILAILRNAADAEDALQETYIGVIRNADKYVPSGKPMAWILMMGKNYALMKLRSMKDEQDISEVEWKNIADKDTRTSSEDRILINSAMRSLSEEEYKVIVLHAAGGMKHREISEIMEVPLSTILSRYNRALKKLKKIIGEDVTI